MNPHGDYNPVPAEFDPAAYPWHVLVPGSEPDAPTVIGWTLDGTLTLDFAEAAAGVLVGGGHVLVMARDAEARDRAETAMRALLGALIRGGSPVH